MYLDSDVLVQSDLAALFDADTNHMNKHALGAVEDCTQSPLSTYVDFPLRVSIKHVLDNASASALHGKVCVANRGILVINVRQWRASGITRTIERLLRRFIASNGRLWHEGVSQPPLLLALGGRYSRLEFRWNVRGMGRNEMNGREWNAMRRVAAQVASAHAPAVVAVPDVQPNFRNKSKSHLVPYVQPYAYHANLLHFNGQLKPWCSRAVPAGGALCAVNVSHYAPCHTLWWAEAERLLGTIEGHITGNGSGCATGCGVACSLPPMQPPDVLTPSAWPMELPVAVMEAIRSFPARIRAQQRREWWNRWR